MKQFKYLGSVISSEGTLEHEINERIEKTGRLFNAIKTNLLGKKEVPVEVKSEVVRKVVKPTLSFASETWTTTQRQRNKLNSMEMRFLRKIQGKTRRDRIRNEVFREQLKIIPIQTTIEQSQIRWLGHIQRMGNERMVKRIYEAREVSKRKRGRPRNTWKEEVRSALEARGLTWNEVPNLAQDRKEWRKMSKRI